MSKIRTIQTIIKSKPTLEGAGVHLNRVFGFSDEPMFDPFLLLDDFRSDRTRDYIKGFPWHPHRGIETITYVLEGDVEHGDSLGNKGIINSGDIQWMTAGSGIIHQEMPKGDDQGKMYGFQLWANLPASHKMMPPRYRDIKSVQIPEIQLESGITIKIIAGEVNDVKGPVGDIVIDPEYLDISLPPDSEFNHKTKSDHTVFAYVISGEGYFGKSSKPLISNGTAVLFEAGDKIEAFSNGNGMRFLLISGKPLNEPVAWYGPIVMNTQEELRIAFEEYNSGDFIKNG